MMKQSFGSCTMKVFVVFVIFSAALSAAFALKCFICGKYTAYGAGSVIPCYEFNQTDLKDCHTGYEYCLKYLNEGIVIRDCVKECKAGVQELSEFFCCQEDGCNGTSSLSAPYHFIAIFATLWILWR